MFFCSLNSHIGSLCLGSWCLHAAHLNCPCNKLITKTAHFKSQRGRGGVGYLCTCVFVRVCVCLPRECHAPTVIWNCARQDSPVMKSDTACVSIPALLVTSCVIGKFLPSLCFSFLICKIGRLIGLF